MDDAAREFFNRHPLAACRFLRAYVESPEAARALWLELELDEALAAGADCPDLVGSPAERDRLGVEAAAVVAERFARSASPEVAARCSDIVASFDVRGVVRPEPDREAGRRFYARNGLAASLWCAAFFGLGRRATAEIWLLDFAGAIESGELRPRLQGSDAEGEAIMAAGLDALPPAGATWN